MNSVLSVIDIIHWKKYKTSEVYYCKDRMQHKQIYALNNEPKGSLFLKFLYLSCMTCNIHTYSNE